MDRATWTFAALWCAMVFWTATQVLRAQAELQGVHAVHGLDRVFQAPYEHELGWVIDPRSIDVVREFNARFGHGHPQIAPKTIDERGFRNALQGAGYSFDVSTVPGDGSYPIIRGARGHTHLALRKFGLQWVVFYPGVGVVLADELPESEWELTLRNAREWTW